MKHKTPAVLLFVLALLIGADYLSAWVAPATMPPASNVAAPLNTGAANQVKSAGLSLNTLFVTGATMVGLDLTPEANLLLDVNGRVGASEYCDENGVNCFTAASVSGNTGATMTCVNRSGAGSASCLAGEIATGGGCTSSCAGMSSGNCTDHSVITSRPTANGWSCTTSNNPITYVRCCTIN